MSVQVRRTVDVDLRASDLWTFVTDWERQGEWVPLTRVEPVGPARAVGGRIRAWTGLGPVGFWDTMTITGWTEHPDGGECEVLHTGGVVRGTGTFAVTSLGAGRSRFTWYERLDLPLGPLGRLGWSVVGPLFARGVDRALARMADRALTLAAADAPGHGT